MSTNLFSAVKYTDVTGETRFTIPFPYLRRDHIFVFLQNEGADPVTTQTLVRGVDWNFYTGNQIELTSGVPSEFHTVTLRRFTRKDQRLSNYHDGSALTEDDLNDVTRQLLYLVQEIDDYSRIADEGIPGGTDPGGTGTIAQEVLDQLLGSQLFQDLTALIDLVNINAESVIANVLSDYAQFTLEEERQQFIALLGDLLVGPGASVQTLTDTRDSETESFAQRIETLKAGVDGNNAYIATVEQALVDEQEATATRFDLIGTNFEGNLGSITDLQQATAGQNSVVSLLTTEVIAKLDTSDLDAELAQSSYLSGVIATVENDAEAGIQAAVDQFDIAIAEVNDNLTVFGNDLSLLTTETSANTALLTQMGSQFGGDPDNPIGFVAAIQNAWETYADTESTAATAVQQLEANTLPIFFDNVDPPAYDREPYASGPFTVDGFPDGAVWYRSLFAAGRTRILSYVFRPGVSTLSGFEGIDPDDPEPYAYLIPEGPEGGRRGAWISGEASAIGALIRDSSSVNIDEDGATAMFTQLVEGVWEDRVGAVEQATEVFLDPDGYVNTQWMVRMNQYLNGTPVIAGFGLGLETDPENPDAGAVSNMIVMADNFAVIKPPTNGDLVDGPLDPADQIVPFLVDADGAVHVATDLFVEDNLWAYRGRLREAFVGRAVFGQMAVPGGEDLPEQIDPQWNSLVDPNGFRLELLSSTDGYWTGPERNYLLWAGTGNRNDNNAVFYVDEDGNAFFGGMVQAQNINGSLANVDSYQVAVNPWVFAPNTTPGNPENWVTVGPVQEFDITALRLMRPVIQATVNMVHGRSGKARLMLRYEQTPGGGDYTSWQEADAGSCTMDRTDGQTQIVLMGTTGANTRGRVQIRVDIAGPYGHDISSAGWNAIALALPTSSTAATNNAPPPDPDDNGDPDEGGGIPPGGGIDPGGPGVIIEP